VNVKKTLWSVLIGTLLLSPLEDAKEKHIKDTPGADGDRMQSKSIPVSIHRGFLVVASGQIGGRKENFVVDTGTSPSILNERLAAKMGLAVTSGSIVAAGRAVNVGQTVLPELELGPIRATDLAMTVLDLTQLEKHLGMEVAGLIGMDVLRRASFRLDYKKKELVFGKVEEEGIAVGCDGASGLGLAEATLQGRPVRLIVDTGSDLLVVYGKSWEKAGAAVLVSDGLEGTSVAEQVAVRQIAKPEMELGGREFRELRAFYVPSAAGVGYDGFVGVSALRLRGVSFDRERQRMYLVN
jgi:predicted aspartyl protease